MHALPPHQAIVRRLDAPSHSAPRPDESAPELHYEEPPNLTILNAVRATQVSYAVTGDMVARRGHLHTTVVCDPESIAIANRVLALWFREYSRGSSSFRRA